MALPTLLLERGTSQSPITVSQDTAVAWQTVVSNSGPSSWFSMAAPSSIVMPWAGPYMVNVCLCWDEVDGGERHGYLVEGTNLAANQRAYDSYISTDASEAGPIYSKFSHVLNVPAAGTVYTVGCKYTTGTNFLEVQFGHPPAQASFTYLGAPYALPDRVEAVATAYSAMGRVGALARSIG